MTVLGPVSADPWRPLDWAATPPWAQGPSRWPPGQRGIGPGSLPCLVPAEERRCSPVVSEGW
eukprot:14134427-Alexandrium_andersonii.AAC.1